MVFLKRDAKWISLTSFIYSIVNLLFTLFSKSPYESISFLNLYNWYAWLVFFAIIVLSYINVYFIAIITQKRRGFKNGQWINESFDVEDDLSKQDYKLDDSRENEILDIMP
jgi:uncharacterized membrane protein YbhN (UPF0104 family)